MSSLMPSRSVATVYPMAAMTLPATGFLLMIVAGPSCLRVKRDGAESGSMGLRGITLRLSKPSKLLNPPWTLLLLESTPPASHLSPRDRSYEPATADTAHVC